MKAYELFLGIALCLMGVALVWAPFVIAAGRASRQEQDRDESNPGYGIRYNEPVHEPANDYQFRVAPYMLGELTEPIDTDATKPIPVTELLGPEPTTYVSNGDRTARQVET